MVGPGGCGAVEAGWIVFGEPVGNELFDGVGLDHGAGEDVGAKLTGFLEEEYAEVFVAGGGGELFKTNGSGETSWA